MGAHHPGRATTGSLKGFAFSTLERIGGTPCVLVGLAAVRRTSKRDDRAARPDAGPAPAGRARLPRRGRADLGPVRPARRLRRLPLAERHRAPRRPPGVGRGAGVGRPAGQALRRRDPRLRPAGVRGPGRRQRPRHRVRPRDAEARATSTPRSSSGSTACTRTRATAWWPSAGRWKRTCASSLERLSGSGGSADVELRAAIRARRMVRAFTDRPVPPALVDDLIDLARRAPSAGNTQPWQFVVLEGAETSRLWDVTLPPDRRSGFRWQGLLDAPVVVVPVVDPTAYPRRYAEADKAATGLGTGPEAWTVPYWWVDGGMAVHGLLLGAVDAGLGALFFGLFAHEAAGARRTRRPGWPPGARRGGAGLAGRGRARSVGGEGASAAARGGAPGRMAPPAGCEAWPDGRSHGTAAHLTCRQLACARGSADRHRSRRHDERARRPPSPARGPAEQG